MQNEHDDAEIWRSIPDLEGFYEASTHGRIRSLTRIVKHKDGKQYEQAGRILKPSGSNKYLYRSVRISVHGNKRTSYVHHLVLTTFVGPMPEGMEACHGDGDRTNNRLSNLRWDTRKANAADRVEHGTATIGEAHPMAKLTEEKVLAMRKRRAEGASSYAIAAEFNVSVMTAFRAITGRSWSNLK